MATAAQFSINLSKIAKDLPPKVIVLLHKKIALEALKRVVQKSPVDTGRFRGNWMASIGVKSTDASGQNDPSGSSSLGRGSAVIGNIQPYTVIYLTNNLPYAERLENGWSKRAPQGMVTVTAAEIKAHFAKVTKV